LKIEYAHRQKFHYLTVSGKFLTPNATIAQSTNVITGPINASTVCDWISTPNLKELVVNLTIQEVTGISPAVEIFLDVLDPVESNNYYANNSQNLPLMSLNLNSSPISTVTNIRAIISNGQLTIWQANKATVLGYLNVPFKWQIRFSLSGTSPSFSIIGTYEARE
jgi:hypothetical protein